MASATQDRFLIKDPVHGSIELHGDYLVSIIESKEFQRLRRLKQLGGACYVYPGATHTRFEHSIGVCYIASELIEHLKKNSELRQDSSVIFKKWSSAEAAKKNKRIPDIIKCVKTAALCHDLGHGPFSHLYDHAVKNATVPYSTNNNENLKDHEYRSVAIFEKIADKSQFSASEIKLVGKLITFSDDYKIAAEKKKHEQVDHVNGNTSEPMSCIPEPVHILKEWKHNAEFSDEYNEIVFLFEIVANGITCVDVDKMDYFLRDGHFTGLTGIHFDWRRYIQTVEIRNWHGFNRLCSREKEAPEIYQLFHIRNQLHHQACRHKTVVAVESRLKQALIEANKDLVIKKGCQQSKHILQAWDDMDYFHLLTDSIEDIIMQPLIYENELPNQDKRPVGFYLKSGSKGKGIKKAREIIQHIRERKLMKFIGEMKEHAELSQKAKVFSQYHTYHYHTYGNHMSAWIEPHILCDHIYEEDHII